MNELKNWRLLRQDDNGGHFVIQEGLTKIDATQLKEEYEARGHIQIYWVEQVKSFLPDKVVFVDVDDTLIRTVGSKRIPNPSCVNAVRKLYAQECIIYCWSSGGPDYCQEIARELDLEECFVAYLPKPDIMIDDQHPNNWINLNVLHPNQVDDLE